jgi:hypothetical protein
MLESTLEIMQHFYVQMTTEPSEYSIFPVDIAYYTLKCTKCDKSISPHGSIRKRLMHAPYSMLHHWDIIQHKDDINDDEIDSMPFLFTSSERCLQSKNLLKEAWNSMSGDKVEELISKKCKYHDYREHHRFCEAVRVDMAN